MEHASIHRKSKLFTCFKLILNIVETFIILISLRIFQK
ncbi:Uncharacterised protein [Klebsiella pneumoniae]|nr:Uncharacterised protein [Klebsiella pneumoniae]